MPRQRIAKRDQAIEAALHRLLTWARAHRRSVRRALPDNQTALDLDRSQPRSAGDLLLLAGLVLVAIAAIAFGAVAFRTWRDVPSPAPMNRLAGFVASADGAAWEALPSVTMVDLARLPMVRVRVLKLQHVAIADEAVRNVHWFPNLAELVLDGSSVTSEAISTLPLSNPSSLYSLSLRDTNADDGCVDDLAELKQLNSLRLDRTMISDSSLAKLPRLKHLNLLTLGETAVTDAGVRSLAGIESLTSLDLNGTEVTDESVDFLARLPNLQWLSLAHTKITDGAMEQLARSRSLLMLDLEGCEITDEGLRTLLANRTLGWVGVRGTKVTPAAVRAARRPGRNVTGDEFKGPTELFP